MEIQASLPVTSCLSLRDGILRIIIHRPSGRPITEQSPDLGRYRFSYAHELIHSLAYDLRSLPCRRVAPLPKTKEEEVLCNYGARHLIMPPELLRKELESQSEIDARFLVALARKGRVSLQVLGLQLCGEKLLPPPPNTIYLLSKIGFGSDGEGIKKARCIACVYYDSQGHFRRFLGSNEGIDRIGSGRGRGLRWTLIKAHDQVRSGTYAFSVKVKDEEIVLANKARVLFTGTHEQLSMSGYIWTKGMLLPIE